MYPIKDAKIRFMREVSAFLSARILPKGGRGRGIGFLFPNRIAILMMAFVISLIILFPRYEIKISSGDPLYSYEGYGYGYGYGEE
jgi:hypothetical protein